MKRPQKKLQRKIVWNLIRFFEIFFPEKRFHLIFASHSPIIISDIPKSNVCFLGREKVSDNISVVTPKIDNTFAANIYSLYRNSYFLENGTMGAFAEEKINDLFRVLEEGSNTSRDHDLIKIVGKPIIRNTLQRKLWNKMNIHNRIEILEKELEKLKGAEVSNETN